MKKLLPAIFCCFIFFNGGSLLAQQSKAGAGQMPVDTSFLININGIDQYLEIKAASRADPILLFIHGGPSWPATPMIRKYNQNLTRNFVLVSWDQRNCGKSKSDTTAILTPDLYVEDAHQVTQYLKKAFHTDKILVACHGWGSIIGIYLVTKYPGDYSAYIGLGQFVNPNKSEMIARNYVKDQANLFYDTATLNALASTPFTEEQGYKNGFEDLIRFRMAGNKYMTSNYVDTLPDPARLYSDYGAIDWMGPMMKTGKLLFNYMNATHLDLFPFNEFKIPMYFFVGKYDYITSSTIVEQYYKSIKAPRKNLYWFEYSGHSPNWEEPTVFYQRILQVATDCKIK